MLQLCCGLGFSSSEAPSYGPMIGTYVPTMIFSSRLASGLSVSGAPSHSPTVCSFQPKLKLCGTPCGNQDGARALRAVVQEMLGELGQNSLSAEEEEEVLEDKKDDGDVDDEQTVFEAQSPPLRLDALDLERDFRRRRPRPRLDVDSSKHRFPAKPGKRQNLPPKARRMILQLRSSPPEEVLSTLKSFSFIRPDRADWLYVIRFLREKEDKSMLLQVYDFLLLEQPAFRAGAQDYTNLILVHIQLKNHEAVEQTLKVMVEREVFPDLVMYTVVIAMYGKIGNFDMVKEKFSEMKLWGLVPDTLVYCALIEAYSQLGHAREAEMFLKDMELAGLSFKIEIFISLIRGYGKIGQTKDAERLFQLMQLKCFYPERRSYSALMDAYTKDEDIEHAVQVFENMVSVGIEPTDKSLARLLVACQNKNMLGEATKMIEKLESKSFKFGTKTLVSFNGWLEKLGLEKEAEHLSREIVKRMRRKAYFSKRFNDGAFLPTWPGP